MVDLWIELWLNDGDVMGKWWFNGGEMVVYDGWLDA